MNRRALGMLFVAVGVAASTVGVAALFAQKPAPRAPTIAVAPQPAAPTISSDWRGVLAAVSPNTVTGATDYVAPAGLASTDALARELFSDYAGARQGGILDMKKATAAIDETIARRVKDAAPAPTYTLSDLSIKKTPVATYEGALAKALAKAGGVSEYELVTFTNVTSGADANGLQKLHSAATTYRSIVAALVATPVPDSVATEHLAVINSISALATATEGLSGWTGDPLDALTLVNAFAVAEKQTGDTVQVLADLTRELEKKS